MVTGERRKEGLESEQLRLMAEDGGEAGRGLGCHLEGVKVEEGREAQVA